MHTVPRKNPCPLPPSIHNKHIHLEIYIPLLRVTVINAINGLTAALLSKRRADAGR